MNVKRDSFWYNQYRALTGCERDETAPSFVLKCIIAVISGIFATLALITLNIVSILFFGYYFKENPKRDELPFEKIPYWPRIYSIRITPAGIIMCTAIVFVSGLSFVVTWHYALNNLMNNHTVYGILTLFGTLFIATINGFLIAYHIRNRWGEKFMNGVRKVRKFLCRPVKFVN